MPLIGYTEHVRWRAGMARVSPDADCRKVPFWPESVVVLRSLLHEARGRLLVRPALRWVKPSAVDFLRGDASLVAPPN